MLIAVLANDTQWNELAEGLDKKLFVRADHLTDDATAYLILEEKYISLIKNTEKPVLLNAVVQSLAVLNTSENVCRINGWNGFLQRTTWEVGGTITTAIKQIFTALNKQYIQVADEPGFVAARSISMIVNEAYFALNEAVSSKEEIDIAMKLGTNYPMGPFEWAEKIGLKNIYDLLTVLNKTDTRYLPATLLEKEANT